MAGSGNGDIDAYDALMDFGSIALNLTWIAD
jgi:hypothetical protein